MYTVQDTKSRGMPLLCTDGQVCPHAQTSDIPFSQQADLPDFIVRPQLVEPFYCVDERTRNDVINLVLICILEGIVKLIKFLIDITSIHICVSIISWHVEILLQPVCLPGFQPPLASGSFVTVPDGQAAPRRNLFDRPTGAHARVSSFRNRDPFGSRPWPPLLQ
jgi:hypothetical protein